MLIPLFLLYRKLRPIKQKTLREDAHEFVWKMYCVPNSAQQSVQAHWESVMSRSVLARFVLLQNIKLWLNIAMMCVIINKNN